MAPLKRQVELSVQESKLYEELDKGIDDMENSRIVTHDEAMRQIKERLEIYGV